ncbi:FAD/NAD(P)-binding oxidoreductase [Streptosporangium sp. NPDC049644]|uniref:NAD(P)/FAD-dependent oxidoreductase n=1 Tax=Streptosporangium sp. NPDC049644 TaxID=3155507 RepID=UPI0034388627
METMRPAVAVVGAGPAGLTAAAELAGLVDGEILVLERERVPGGIPRHSDHTGYGLRDLRRVMSGPGYARLLHRRAERAGARILTEATVTQVSGDRELEVTTPSGLLRVEPRALVLATGARERPRPARLITGDRGAGVYTTGHLQNLVHLHHGRPGKRAVIVGAELVSWSAVLTLREAGCRTVLMTTSQPVPESYAAFHLPGRALLRVPVATGTRLVSVEGDAGRVSAVVVEHVGTGRRRRVECDTVVLTGDWIPDHELARGTGLHLDPRSRGPVVDTALRTSRPGVFAAGNLIHPVDTADIAALDGRHVAAAAHRWLADERLGEVAFDIEVDAPLRWVAPSVVRRGDPPPSRGRLLLWTDTLVRSPVVRVHQAGRPLARRRLPWPASPGRVFRVPWSLLARAEPDAGPVRLSLEG